MSTNIAHSVKVLAFTRTVIHPLLSRRWRRNECIQSTEVVTPSKRSKRDPPKTWQSRGNYRQLFEHQASSHGVSIQITREIASRCVKIENHSIVGRTMQWNENLKGRNEDPSGSQCERKRTHHGHAKQHFSTHFFRGQNTSRTLARGLGSISPVCVVCFYFSFSFLFLSFFLFIAQPINTARETRCTEGTANDNARRAEN